MLNKHRKRVQVFRKEKLKLISLRAKKSNHNLDYICESSYDTIYREFDPGSG